MLLVLALIPVARWRRAAMFVAAVVGLGVTALLWSRISGEMEAALRAMRRAGGFWQDPERALAAAWPHVWVWWLMALGVAPAVAFTIELLRPRSVEELRDREERRTDRVRARRERRARKAAGAPKPERRPAGFELGRHIDGDALLPTRHGRVAMPLARLEKTVLVIGAPGVGQDGNPAPFGPRRGPELGLVCVRDRRQRRPAHPTTLRRSDAPGRPPGGAVPVRGL